MLAQRRRIVMALSLFVCWMLSGGGRGFAIPQAGALRSLLDTCLPFNMSNILNEISFLHIKVL